MRHPRWTPERFRLAGSRRTLGHAAQIDGRLTRAVMARLARGTRPGRCASLFRIGASARGTESAERIEQATGASDAPTPCGLVAPWTAPRDAGSGLGLGPCPARAALPDLIGHSGDPRRGTTDGLRRSILCSRSCVSPGIRASPDARRALVRCRCGPLRPIATISIVTAGRARAGKPVLSSCPQKNGESRIAAI